MANGRSSHDDGYPMVDLDSDDGGNISSEDEVQVFLHGTPEQKRRLRRQSLGAENSSEDEFEKEMSAELNLTLKSLRGTADGAGQSTEGQTSSGATKRTNTPVYDNIYFDSDSDEEGTRKEKAGRDHAIPSDDELLYDPHIDDDNQRWVDNRRHQYQPSPCKKQKRVPATGDSTRPHKLPHSDAVLNCPACMTLLCLDCQRHATYKSQYRAMFVMNCLIEDSETLEVPRQAPLSRKQLKKQERKQRKNLAKSRCGVVTDPFNMDVANQSDTNTPTEGASNISNIHMESVDVAEESENIPKDNCSETVEMDFQSVTKDSDMFHPVKCSVCRTEVAVYDKDEIYHFFNILASHG